MVLSIRGSDGPVGLCAAELTARIEQLERELTEARAALTHKSGMGNDRLVDAAMPREESGTLETLNRIGVALAAEFDLDRLVQMVTDAGVELTGAQFGAFFYNVLDDTGGSYMLYALSGADRSAFERFPMPRATAVFQPTFKGEGIIRSDDILADPRYGRSEPYRGMPEGHLPVRSYLAVPVVSRSGEVHGGLFFGHAEPGKFTARAERVLAGVAAQAAVAIDNARLYRAAQRELAERRTVEERLRESEERARLAVEGAKLGAWDWDLETGRGWWSPRTAEMMGVGSGEAITPEQRAALIHPEDRAQVQASVAAAVEGADETALDYRIVRPDGEVRCLVSRGTVTRDPDGRARRITGIVRDVTEERLAAERLRESEERFRLIADSTPTPMWVTRLDRKRDFVNRAYVDFLDISYEAAVDFDWRTVIHPDDMERLLAESVAGEASLKPFTLEGRYRNARGEWRWLRSESQPRWGANGEHIGFIGVAYDVTIAKEAELALQALVADRTAELEALYTKTPTLLHSQSPEGRIISVSDKWLEFMGYECREEVLGRPILDFITPESAERHAAQYWPSLIADGGFDDVEYQAVKKSGEVADVLVSSRVWYDADGRFARTMAAIVDVTDKKRTEERLRQAQKMEAVGQLTGGIAHDFNNLLTPIMGSLDMLRRRLAADERAQRTVDIALQATSRAATLVQRLLAFARRQDLQARSVDVVELVSGMEELIARSLGSSIRVAIDIPAPLPAAHVDPNQLELAILNLAINARDAMPGGGTLVIGVREAELRRPEPDLESGRYIRITVADTGIGMDDATLKRAVEPFFSTKGVGKGTGLGLSMVHGLAAQLGGALRLSSTLGEGTTAELWLPIAAEPAKSATLASAAPRRAERAATILLVDDEDLVRAGTADMLADLGYRVIEASSAAEGLAKLRAGPAPDLLVTDYLMPGMNGVDLAGEALRERPGLPVLMISGYTNLEVGRADLPRLMKPFRQEELAARVAALLKRA